MLNEWNGFNDGVWTKEINVRNFIQKNYTLYEGDDSFLADVSQKTKKVWNKCEELLAKELKKGGVLDVETDIISGITNFAPGYIDKENEVIVGLQTDAPLKRIVNLYGGKRTRLARTAGLLTGLPDAMDVDVLLETTVVLLFMESTT